MSNFWQRAITGLVFVVVMLGAILWKLESFFALILIVNFVCLFEFFKLFKETENKVNPWFGAVAGTLILTLVFYKLNFSFLFFLPFLFLLIFNILKVKKNIFGGPSLLVGGMLYFVVPFLLLLKTSIYRSWEDGSYIAEPYFFALPLIVMVWSNDTFAYVGGKLLGKHKLMSKVSPNKTVEGFVSGLLFASIASYLTYIYLPESRVKFELELYHHLLIGVSVGTAATLGDLIQSSVKRMAGVKDSGKILPGHGGMWDRFDGLVLAIPAYAFVLWVISTVFY